MDLRDSLSDNRIGSRIRARRKQQGFSQDELAQSLGLNDRQILSAIETGIRNIKVQELLLIAEKLGVPFEYFTDPFRLDGEARFSWLQTSVSLEVLNEYETRASQWIGAYRTLAPKVEVNPPLIRPSLSLTKQSRFEDARVAAERFVAEFSLGNVPARRLVEVMEDELNILVLMVNAGKRYLRCCVPSSGFGYSAYEPPRVRRTAKLRFGARTVSYSDFRCNASESR